MKNFLDEISMQRLSLLTKLPVEDLKRESMKKGLEEMLTMMEVLDSFSLQEEEEKEGANVFRPDIAKEGDWSRHFLEQAPVKAEDMLEVASSLEG